MPRAFATTMRRLFALILLWPLAAYAAAGDEQKLGQHFDIRANALPKPYATPSASNSPDVIERPAGARPQVPKGFTAAVFADGLADSRWLAVAKNGDVFLAESDAGKVTVLRDADGNGTAERTFTFADDFDRPHGLAFHGNALYVADARAVWRIAYSDGLTRGGARSRVTQDSFGGSGGHWTRNIAFDPKGRLFLAIGSSSNVSEDPAPRATVQIVENGKLRTFASGLRNPVGIAFYPGTSELYVTVNERDGLGDGLVPDYLTHVVEGGFYGWPYAYIGKHPDPDYGKKRPDLVAKSIAPDLLFQAHSAALGLVFYEGNQFPANYRGDAFVAFRGSWNSGVPTGYKVVHVPFSNGRPSGGYDNFAVGFWAKGRGNSKDLGRAVSETLGLRTKGSAPANVWGRPVGLAVAKDGSLLVADDASKVVWRIAYSGK